MGIKLELTHACNLRCDFCYTDSPRHTLQRTADLSDETWRRVVAEAIELGVVEAVLTGGEPLLRQPLALELLDALSEAGIAVTLNTNGWFVDERLADRLAASPGLTVSVSIDGATPELHDAARGVPGSWRRAVRAVDLLLERDVAVTVGHVVTPLNAPWVPELLEHLWILGVRSVRLTPVVPVGAASREDGWTVKRRELRRAVESAAERFGEDFRPVVQSGTAEIIATREGRAPAALLVRPSGSVLIDSLHPFAFGRVEDGLAECWRRIVSDWRDPEIQQWAGRIRSSRGLAKASVVPYADQEPRVGEHSAPRSRKAGAASPALPRRAHRSTEHRASAGDLPAARRHVLGLALARRYRVAPLKWSGDREGDRVVRVLDSGRMCRLNPTAGMLLDQLADASVGDAAATFAERYPTVPRERVELDAIRTVRWLATRGVLRSATAGAPS